MEHGPAEALRRELRAFLAASLPEDIRESSLRLEPLTREQHVRWQRILHARGWAAPHWPREHGGLGWDVAQMQAFEEECALAGAPRVMPFGINMLGPVLIRHGSEAQRSRLLPRILAAEDWWCQGFSEPGAGSDLAALRTRATLDGDLYRVTGQKTWTSYAQFADRMFCLVRTGTGARASDGITFLLLDMRAPGVSVRPIAMLDGSVEINEVFLDDVAVPAADRVGAEGEGWTIARFLLAQERTGMAGVGRARLQLRRAHALAAQAGPLEQARLARLEVDVLALEATLLRGAGALGETAQASLLKIRGSEIQMQLHELLVDLAGAASLEPGAAEGDLPAPAALLAQYLNGRKLAIFGGSNEIQRGIIARQLLPDS